MAQPETSGKVLRSGYIEMSPFSFTDKDGNATGVINQFQRQLIRAAGYEWQAKPFPIKRMVKSVVEGEVDVYIGFLKNSQLQNVSHVSNLIGGSIVLGVYHLVGTPGIAQPSDLIGHKLGFLYGFKYGELASYFQQHLKSKNLLELRDESSGFALLNARKIDYMMHYYNASIVELMNTHQGLMQKSELPSPKFRLMVSRSLNNSQQVLMDLESAFKVLKESGNGLDRETSNLFDQP